MSSSSAHSPLVSAGVCLRILRRLLDDESVVLAQLSYVVENIHNPLLENCGGTSYLKLLPEVPPAMSTSTLHTLSQRAVGANPLADESRNNTDKSSEGPSSPLIKILPPQPAVVVRSTSGVSRGTATAAAAASRAKGGKPTAHTGKKGAKEGNGGGTPSGAPPQPTSALSFAEYWELFSNLPTLYTAQRNLVKNLENAVCDVAALLDRLQGEQVELGDDEGCRPAENDETKRPASHTASDGEKHASETPPPDSAVTREGAGTSSGQNTPGAAPPIPLAQPSSSIFLRSPQVSSSTAPTADANEALQTLGEIICSFFGSENMVRLVAEHTMYTVNYTSKAAPRVLELGRLWRRGAARAPQSGSSSASASAALSPVERAVLLQYGKFFDFLLRSFGSSGVPCDCRVLLGSLPEFPAAREANNMDSGMAASAGSNGNGSNSNPAPTAGGVGTVRGQMTLDVNVSGVADARAGNGTRGGGANIGGAAVTGSSGAAKPKKQRGTQQQHLHFPSLPHNWKGIHTLLMLLATPLPCLRRYLHVARCIVESHTIPQAARQRLQTSFITMANAQGIEEEVLAMEELAQHDVRAIMSLIDDSSSATIFGPDGTTGGEGGASLLAQFRNPSSPRVLVHYGRLYKRSGRGKNERLMFLFTDWICYVEELNSGRMRLRGAMPLDTLRVIDVADSPALDIINCLELINAQTKRFIFFVSTPEQKRQWVDAIRFAVHLQNRARLRAKLASTNAPSNSSMAAAAAAAANTSVFYSMRPKRTSGPLPPASRLRRQQRYDQGWQNYLDTQNAMASSRLPSPRTSASPNTSVLRGGLSPMVSTTTPLALHASLGGAPSTCTFHSRTSSFGQTRGTNAHRQLEYDVTPWSRQSATHRRLRGSHDLFLSTPVSGAVPQASSFSRQSSTLSLAGSDHGAEANEADEAGQHKEHRDSQDKNRDSLAATGNAPVIAHDDPLRSFKLLPGATSPFVMSIPHPPSKTDSVGGGSTSSRPPIPSTPLRRPVSERFEVAQPPSTPASRRSQRASSLPGSAVNTTNTRVPHSAAVPPRAPAASSASFPRARRDSAAADRRSRDREENNNPIEEAAVTGDGDAPREDVDSQLSSLMSRQKKEDGQEDSEVELGSTSFTSHSSGTRGDDRQHHHSDGDGSNEEEDSGTGSASLVEDYAGTATGEPAPSEDAADLPLAVRIHSHEVGPTGFDEEERVTAALTAFRPRDTATLSSLSFSPVRRRLPEAETSDANVDGDGGALDSASEGSHAVPAAAGGPAPRAPQTSQRHMDPSQGLEAILQHDEAREAEDSQAEKEESEQPHGEDADHLDDTDDGDTGFDNAEKEVTDAFVDIPDTSLDLSEEEVNQHEMKTGKKKKK